MKHIIKIIQHFPEHPLSQHDFFLSPFFSFLFFNVVTMPTCFHVVKSMQSGLLQMQLAAVIKHHTEVC